MEVESLEQLEARISKALELLTQYRETNQELQRQNKELLAKVQECELNLEKFKAENSELREAREQSQLSAVQQEEIKNKIEGMLSKLDNL